MKSRFTLLIFLFALSGNSIFSQTSTIIGTVTDQEGKPLEFINIGIEGTTKGTSTNEEGKYKIENINSGSYTIIASSIGYKTESKKISLLLEQVLEINFELLHVAIELQSVEIIGRRAISYDNKISFVGTKNATLVKDVPQAISFVTKEVFADQQAYRVNDIVKNISGVNQFSWYDDFSMRGFRSGETYINGLRVIGLFGPQPLLANIERVEVLKGPASAMFGNSSPRRNDE